jgi:hypothetical protein
MANIDRLFAGSRHQKIAWWRGKTDNIRAWLVKEGFKGFSSLSVGLEDKII